MNECCENCKYYKQKILIPCQGRCEVTRVKRNWNSRSCQFFEKRELKAEMQKGEEKTMLTVPRQIDVEQAKQIYQQGAKNFAEWIDNNINIGIYDYFGNRISAIELLGEWKKGVENGT